MSRSEGFMIPKSGELVSSLSFEKGVRIFEEVAQRLGLMRTGRGLLATQSVQALVMELMLV